MTIRRDRALPRTVRFGVGRCVAAVLTGTWLALGLNAGEAHAAAASLTLTPDVGTPAQVIQADGAGFCGNPAPACGTVSISFEGYGDVVGRITVSASGTFTAHFQPPAGPPGSRSVTATQNNAGGSSIFAVSTFTLVLQPSGASPPPHSIPPTSTPPHVGPSSGPTSPSPAPTTSSSPSPAPKAAPNQGGGPPAAGTHTGSSLPFAPPSWMVGLLLMVAAAAVAATLWLRMRIGA